MFTILDGTIWFDCSWIVIPCTSVFCSAMFAKGQQFADGLFQLNYPYLSLCLWCGRSFFMSVMWKSFSMSAMLKVWILWARNIPEDQLCIVFAERFNGECCGCGIRSPHTCRTLVGLCRLMCYQKLSRTAVWLLVGLITAPKVSDNWLEFQNIGWSLVCRETILWILRSFSFIALTSECLCVALSSWKT
jgi:hypothetical protein